MDYQYKVIVSNRSIYKEFEIPADMARIRLGTTSSCEFRLNSDAFFDSIEMEFEKKNSQWEIVSTDTTYISRGDMRKLLSTELTHGDILSVRYAASGDEAFEIRFMIDFEAKVPDYNWFVDISAINSIEVSTEIGADISVQSQFLKNGKIRLAREGKTFFIEEITSDFGIYVNGQQFSGKTKLSDCDFFSIAEFSFYFKGGKVYFDKNNVKINNLNVEVINNENNTLQYPLYNRSTRVRRKFSDEKIEILDAPEIPAKPENNIVLSLLPAVSMLILTIVFRGIMSTSTGTYVIMSVCSMSIGLITSILSFMSGHKKYKKECEDRTTKYTAYIEKKRNEISKARQEELDSLNEMYCDIEQDINTIENFDRRLFEKTKEDEDFLRVYLGRGTVEAKRPIEIHKQERLEVGDELTDMPEKISDMFSYIDYAPVCMELKNSNAVGIVGSNEYLYNMFKNIVIDISARHYFGDVRLFALVGDEKKYNWLRLLPHLVNGNNTRNIVFDNASKNNTFENLFKELTRREQTKHIPYHGVVLIENEFGIKNHPISRYIETASTLGMTFVFFENSVEKLPLYCNEIAMLTSENTGELYDTEDGGNKIEFRYNTVSDEQIDALIHKLAPVYCEEISLENSLRKNISLFELLHIYAVEDLDLKERWDKSEIYRTMEAPLGVNAKDEVVYLNLHEKAHGPHGLVAGTTGSGKSEILQSYILSAATIYHPYEIGFVIIDFKGGGMVNQFRDLPHLIGAITNIDGNEVQRSLKSIKAELVKRQSFFAQAGVNHIDKYIQLFKEKKVTTALPHLVIIVDEFAELKAEQPEFMKELISAARIGRSLGVHLILATQKPTGVVDAQIWSNSKFKLCLKVQSKEDSNEVIKTPLAAEIKEPGRAYLQVGNNEIFELFQSAYSGASATVDDSDVGKAFKISQLDFAGMKKTVYEKKKVVKKGAQSKNQLDAIVEYISTYCEKENIKRLPNICMPPLPENLFYEKTKKKDAVEVFAQIGLLDDPDRQRQDKLEINITSQNYIIVGSAQSGKTNILQAIIRSLAENYTPKEVNMYMIDFGSMILRNFEGLNHCGGVVCPSNDERLKNLFKLLDAEILSRKEKFANLGVSSFTAYKEAGCTDLPQIVVFIDNMTALKEMYLQEDDVLLRLCRDSIAVGISFVVANSQTAGIGYRYLNNFEGRMALFCNESSEYSTMFEGCRMKLPNISGRTLVQLNKAMYEAQMYIAFEGEKEFERVQSIQQFVENVNQNYAGQKAKIIPEIPRDLNASYMEKNYASYMRSGNVLLGLDYNTVLPAEVDVAKGGMFVLSGKADKGKDIFTKYFIESMLKDNFGETELYVVDDVAGKWKDYEFDPKTAIYTNTMDAVPAMLDEIEQCAQARMEMCNRNKNALDDEPWIVLLIESNDFATEMSADKKAVASFRNIIGKYSDMKIFVLFTNVENANISFSAPELMKVIKDNKRYLIFEDVSNIKICDISLSVTKKYAKPLEFGDAYLIRDTEITKIKTTKLM